MPGKFRSYGQLDDPIAEDGDLGFLGIDQFSDPTTLKPGFLQNAENVRIETGQVATRKGLKHYPLSEPGALSMGRFSDPAGEDYVAIVFPTKVLFWSTSVLREVALPVTIASHENPRVLQLFGKVVIFRAGQRPLEFDGDFAVAAPAFTAKSTSSPGAGLIACPNAGFGVYFRNRLIVPNPDDSPTTIILSDIFDDNTFLRTDGEFFLNKGTSDETRAIIPYLEDQLLCMNRRSIHILNNLTNPTSANTYEITRQFGIIGPEAWAQSGAYTYFISAEGDVQVITPQTDPAKGMGIAVSKALAENVPVSRPIQKVMDRMNIAAGKEARGITFKNRVYFAIPLDNSEINSTCIVYDALLSAWVSIDTFPTDFGIKNFATMQIGNEERLMVLGTDGSLYLFEESDMDEIGGVSTLISSKIKSRSYLVGDRGIKRFLRGQIGVEDSIGSSVAITAGTTSPDTTTEVRREFEPTPGYRLIRFGLRRRGYACDLELTTLTGRPTIKNFQLEGAVSTRATRDVG